MTRLDLPLCPECERMWQACQRATNEHLRLLSVLNQASTQLDRHRAELLIQQVSAAEYARKKARDALETHRLASGHK
jgi:hypothetical protein